MESMWTIASRQPQQPSPVAFKVQSFSSRRVLKWMRAKPIVSIMMTLMIYGIITVSSSIIYTTTVGCYAFVPSVTRSRLILQPPPPPSSHFVVNHKKDLQKGIRVSFPVKRTTTTTTTTHLWKTSTTSTPLLNQFKNSDVTWHSSSGGGGGNGNDKRRPSPLFSVRRYCPNVQRGVHYMKERFLHFVHRTLLISRNTKNVLHVGTRILYHQIRRTIFLLSLFCMITFHSCFLPNIANAAAVSGGRVGGGSFKSSSSSGRVSTRSRPYSSSSRSGRSYYPSSSLPLLQLRTSQMIINSFSGTRGWYAPTAHESTLLMSRVSTKDIILVTGTGMLLAYGYHNQRRRDTNGDGNDSSILGYGYTVGSMTVSINVPDRSSSDNILHQLNQLAMSADTMTKRGLQDLLSAVTLELLRHEQSITSAYTQSKLYPIMGQAEREFQVLSVASQSKVDRLTVNKWNAPVAQSTTGVVKSDIVESTVSVASAPTTAIVTINFAMEGDSTVLPVIKSRDDVHSALSLIASDALVGDCLMTAEVLWSPEDITETLSREATYVDFPNLVPI